jgi:hypothetical protein
LVLGADGRERGEADEWIASPFRSRQRSLPVDSRRRHWLCPYVAWRTSSMFSSFEPSAPATVPIAAPSQASAAYAPIPAAWPALVVGFVGHGLKDLWQHRTHFVNNTRWWPPFCMVVDFVVAAVIVVEIAAGLHFR